MKINPYLNFNGRTEEAFNFYKSIFGGEFRMLQRFKEIPSAEKPMPAAEGERIMHVSLPIGENMLMGSDVPEEMSMKLQAGNNVYLSLHAESLEEAERFFKRLSEGGKIEMPLEKMFWGAYFASLVDKFGICWMVNYEEPEG